MNFAYLLSLLEMKYSCSEPGELNGKKGIRNPKNLYNQI